MKLVRSLPEMCASRVWPLGVSFPGGLVLAQHFHLEDGVGQCLAHDASISITSSFDKLIASLWICSVCLVRTGGSERHILPSVRHEIRQQTE